MSAILLLLFILFGKRIREALCIFHKGRNSKNKYVCFANVKGKNDIHLTEKFKHLYTWEQGFLKGKNDTNQMCLSYSYDFLYLNEVKFVHKVSGRIIVHKDIKYKEKN